MIVYSGCGDGEQFPIFPEFMNLISHAAHLTLNPAEPAIESLPFAPTLPDPDAETAEHAPARQGGDCERHDFGDGHV